MNYSDVALNVFGLPCDGAVMCVWYLTLLLRPKRSVHIWCVDGLIILIMHTRRRNLTGYFQHIFMFKVTYS